VEQSKNSDKEFELPKDIEKYANSLEIWLLKKDKYIDVKYRPQIRKLGFKIGVISAIIFFLLLQLVHYLPKDIFLVMMSLFVFSMLATGIQMELWFRPQRVEQEIRKKQPYDCGCDRSRIPDFNEWGWISRRFWAHYTCNLYQMWFSASWGWFVTSLVLGFVNWTVSGIFKLEK
jgi:hypothetical protein